MKHSLPSRLKQAARDPRPLSEFTLHKFVIELLRFSAKPRVIYFHCPNGEYRSKRTGAKLKAMGVLPGVADLVIVGPRGLVHWLELKKPGEKQSDAQRAFGDLCAINGSPYRVVDNPDDARSALLLWDLIRLPVTTQRPVSRVSSETEARAA